MATYDYDLFTIGAGSGGVRASRLSASYGARVALAEKRHIGGTCVNVGCVPKKLFVYAAHFSEAFSDAVGFGWNATVPELDWSRLVENKNREIARLNQVYRNLVHNAGVVLIEGEARIVDPHTVEIDGRRITARYLLIAVGGTAARPAIQGIDHALTSDDMFFLPELPKRAVILGGGYIAVEFASILHGLGVRTTVVHRGKTLLRGFDRDLSDALGHEFSHKGITLHLERTVERIERRDDLFVVCLNDGAHVETDLVLCATGRVPNTASLGLREIGVVMKDDGTILVDERLRTSVENIYAVGDCTHPMQLTPLALAEGTVVAKTLFTNQPTTVDYRDIPTAVFSLPNVATVGLTEADARVQFESIAIYRTSFRPMMHTLSGRAEKTMMKLVVDKKTDRVLGCHMIGPEAGEIIQGLAIAMKCGATKAQFDATIGIHPTAAEEFVTMRTPVAE